LRRYTVDGSDSILKNRVKSESRLRHLRINKLCRFCDRFLVTKAHEKLLVYLDRNFISDIAKRDLNAKDTPEFNDLSLTRHPPLVLLHSRPKETEHVLIS